MLTPKKQTTRITHKKKTLPNKDGLRVGQGQNNSLTRYPKTMSKTKIQSKTFKQKCKTGEKEVNGNRNLRLRQK